MIYGNSTMVGDFRRIHHRYRWSTRRLLHPCFGCSAHEESALAASREVPSTVGHRPRVVQIQYSDAKMAETSKVSRVSGLCRNRSTIERMPRANPRKTVCALWAFCPRLGRLMRTQSQRRPCQERPAPQRCWHSLRGSRYQFPLRFAPSTSTHFQHQRTATNPSLSSTLTCS
jgi:hypothetical protein